jgi:hypothetical protein
MICNLMTTTRRKKAALRQAAPAQHFDLTTRKELESLGVCRG